VTKEEVKKLLTKLHGPDVRFSKTVTGRESASVPLSSEEKEIASREMSVGRHGPNGEWIEDAEAKQEKLDEVRHVVAARDIITGEWELSRGVQSAIQNAATGAIMEDE